MLCCSWTSDHLSSLFTVKSGRLRADVCHESQLLLRVVPTFRAWSESLIACLHMIFKPLCTVCMVTAHRQHSNSCRQPRHYAFDGLLPHMLLHTLAFASCDVLITALCLLPELHGFICVKSLAGRMPTTAVLPTTCSTTFPACLPQSCSRQMRSAPSVRSP